MDRRGRLTIRFNIRRQSGIEVDVPVEGRLENRAVITTCGFRLTKLEQSGRPLVGTPTWGMPSLLMKVEEGTWRRLRKQ